MKIDRERFLVLAAALATGVSVAPGCSGGQGAPPESPTLQIGTPPQGLPPARPPEVPRAEPTPPPPTFPEPPPPQPAAVAPAPVQPVATNVAAPPSKAPNPYDGTPVTAQACNPALNAVGSPGRCALTAPGPTCESFKDTVSECPTLTTLLKPRVAEAAIACLRKRSGTKDICEFNVTSICAYEALGSACLDPSAKTVCNSVIARCGSSPRDHYNKMSRESCEAGVSGIADAKKKKFIACITESCRFETCLTYL